MEVGYNAIVRSRDPADIQLPVIFADKSDQPRGTPICLIYFIWKGDNYQRESIKPSMLQTFATNMKNQCIAASPPQLATGSIEPSRLISVQFRIGMVNENGNLAVPGVNGTLLPGVSGTLISGINGTLMSALNDTAIPVNLPPINPTDACKGPAEPLYGVDLDDPQPSVQYS